MPRCVFAVVTLGLAGAVATLGLPDWVPLPRPTFAQAQSDLQLDFPARRQDRETLPDKSPVLQRQRHCHQCRATRPATYLRLLVVLRDKRDRIVYEKEIVPAKHKLTAGEMVTVNEALTDIPKSATAAEIGWKPD